MLRALLVCAMTLLAASTVRAADVTPADGALISSVPCVRHPLRYDDDVAAAVKQYEVETALAAQFGIKTLPVAGLPAALATRAEYEDSIAHPSACRRVLYGSDGLAVVALIWEPARIAEGTRLPVIIALHGGSRDLSKWSPDTRRGMASFVSAGFIVIGVQYRGVDGGQGQEQYGGDDVHDVVNAATLARRLPEADPRNMFLFGGSRGGMMVYLAVRDGATVNAAATVSGLTDLELEAKRHPDWEAANFRPLIPNYDTDRAGALARRSGVLVAKTVDLPPILILHGTADWRVDTRESLEVADALQVRGRPYALHVFEGDMHGLTWNWRERDRLVIEWFRRHLVR